MPSIANVDIYAGAKRNAIHKADGAVPRDADLSPSAVSAPGHGHGDGRAPDTDTNTSPDKQDIETRSSPTIRTIRKLLSKRNANTQITKPCDMGLSPMLTGLQ
ncbi:MAG: hypothetical protein Q9160_006517 [Pyrenula sp. 1 TL-2023]